MYISVFIGLGLSLIAFLVGPEDVGVDVFESLHIIYNILCFSNLKNIERERGPRS